MTKDSRINVMKTCLEAAARTLKYLPSNPLDRHQKLRSIWGNIDRTSESISSKTGKYIPSAIEIDDMYHIIDLLMGLPDLERKLLWARANRIPWALLQNQIGRSRTHLYQIYHRGLISLTNLYRVKKPLDIMNKIG